MKRFLIKFRTWFILPAIFLILGITVLVNVVLTVSGPFFRKTFGTYLTSQTSFGNILYLFPNIVVLKNLTIKENTGETENQLVEIPRSVIRFSILVLLSKGVFLPNEILLENPLFHYPRLDLFYKNNAPQIIADIKKLPRVDMKLYVNNTEIDSLPVAGRPQTLRADLGFKYKSGIFSGTGVVRQQTKGFLFGSTTGERGEKWKDLKLYFQGREEPDGFSFDKFIMSSDQVHVNLWGNLKENLLCLKGFSLLDPTSKTRKKQQRFLQGIQSGRNLPNQYVNSFVKGELDEIDLFLLDIDGLMRITKEGLGIEQLNFNLNHTPVHVTGRIGFDAPVSFHLSISSEPSPQGKNRIRNFRQAKLDISGRFQNGGLQTGGELKFYFVENGEPKSIVQRVEAPFENFFINFDDAAGKFLLSLEKAHVSFWTRGNEHRVSLNQLKASVDLLSEGTMALMVRSPFYEGELEGKIDLDITQRPVRLTSTFVVKGVSANELDELLIHYSKVKGTLDSKINFSNYPEFDLNGEINLKNGNLMNFAFFDWLAGAFDLPSLKELNFARISTQFSVNPKMCGINNIHLESENIQINGSFSVDAESLVSSELSLGLSRDLLKESSKFNPVLKILDHKVSYLDFDFRLSGNLHAMNFQWMDSEDKRRIQSRIPDFIERRIEERIDKIN